MSSPLQQHGLILTGFFVAFIAGFHLGWQMCNLRNRCHQCHRRHGGKGEHGSSNAEDELISACDGEVKECEPEKIGEEDTEENDVEPVAGTGDNIGSLLSSPGRDFLVYNNGNKMPISKLEGKIIGLYFTSPSCDALSGSNFTPKLIECYNELNAKDDSFEVVWISLDGEQSFERSLGTMPWPALPANDENCWKLFLHFDLEYLPALVIVGSDGKTLYHDAIRVVEEHGAAAYPFSREKIAELEEPKIKGMPKRIRHARHAEHDLVLTRKTRYFCDSCYEVGVEWSFCCEEQCDFELHPMCV